MKIKKIFPVAFLAIMSLAGCRGGGNNNVSNDDSIPMDSSGNIEFKNIKLTFGNPITGADGAHMRRLVKNFNEEYKGKIEISESYVTEKSFYENLELTLTEYDTNKCVIDVLNNVVVILPLKALVNLEEEKQKLLAEQDKMNNEIKRCENMLKNEKFISKAPAAKVEEEKNKLAAYQARLEEIKKLLLDL